MFHMNLMIVRRTITMPRKNLDRSLLIIDGSNLAHRAYHKFANMRYEGQKTGMIYGFLRLLQQYAIRFRCKYIIVTFDTKQSKSSNFRNELLGSYKILSSFSMYQLSGIVRVLAMNQMIILGIML